MTKAGIRWRHVVGAVLGVVLDDEDRDCAQIGEC